MPREIIKKFEVEYLQILNEEGEMDQSVNPNLSEDMIKKMYHLMLLARTFDEKLFKLQRSGKIGTYAEVKGEEACQIGSAMATAKTDWFVPAFRELAFSLARGADRAKIVQAWNGDTRSVMTYKECRDLPISIPIASQLLHATGIAWASKIKKENDATITFFGDGATSEGDFHEALNFAGVFKLPIVYICQNNGWAISTPRSGQTAAETIAQKAIAYGIHGIQVDGNDVFAVYQATKEAMDRAKKGEGATLIECITYRLGDHTTSDDSLKYRTEEEIKEMWKKEPITRLKLFLQKNNMWDEEYGTWVQEECNKEIDEAVEKGLAFEPPKPEELFTYVFDKMPPDLVKQKNELLEELKEGSQ